MYLDFAATNPISKVWLDSIINSSAKGLYGNPGSYHKAGFDALEMMETSTKNILNAIFRDKAVAEKYDICYNSGSTESINQFLYAFSKKPKALVIYENIAHKAVLKSVEKYFSKNSFKLDFSLTEDEVLDDFESFLDKNKDKYKNFLLVLTSVNNETGGIWKYDLVKELDDKIKTYLNIWSIEKQLFLFLDHTQGFMKHNEKLELADAFCFSAHKIGGMKGFGGLVYKKKLESVLQDNPLIVGGYDIRGGTKDPISVKALDDLIDDVYIKNIVLDQNIFKLHDLVCDKLRNIAKEYNVPLSFNYYSKLFGDQSPYIINASFIGIEGESLMSSLMDDCISTGSACNSSELKTSHVLTGLGIKKLNANCAFRISLSAEVNEEELIDFLDNRFKPAIRFLSRMRTRHGEE